MVKSAAAEADDEQGDDTAGVDQDVGLDFVSYWTMSLEIKPKSRYSCSVTYVQLLYMYKTVHVTFREQWK